MCSGLTEEQFRIIEQKPITGNAGSAMQVYDLMRSSPISRKGETIDMHEAPIRAGLNKLWAVVKLR
jgi:hypothetical protein